MLSEYHKYIFANHLLISLYTVSQKKTVPVLFIE